MVKHELVDALVKAFPGITKHDMSTVVDTLFESMAQALLEGEAVDLRGIGRFKIRERRPIRGRNPKTSISVYLPTRWVVHFKQAGSLSKRINET
ncbi:MAG: integration host factor subunit beta [Desulfobacterales bacterium]|nr:integration host factor subunit beta [Desulfobacterales bacterium]